MKLKHIWKNLVLNLNTKSKEDRKLFRLTVFFKIRGTTPENQSKKWLPRFLNNSDKHLYLSPKTGDSLGKESESFSSDVNSFLRK